MANKQDLAKEIYHAPLSELTIVEKSAVDRAYTRALEKELAGEDDMFALAADEDMYEEDEAGDIVSGVNEVEFGRPGINGVKKSLVNDGCTVEEAFKQTGLEINLKKEGFIVKRSNTYTEGDKVMLTDKVFDGDLYVIVPGVDSSL